MNRGTNKKISSQLTDRELMGQFKQVEKLDQEDKHLIKTFIGAFLTKRQIQKLAKVKSPISTLRYQASCYFLPALQMPAIYLFFLRILVIQTRTSEGISL
jgi:hypothetical protein